MSYCIRTTSKNGKCVGNQAVCSGSPACWEEEVVSRELSELVYRRNGDGPPTWDCHDCGKTVFTQTEGAPITWVVEAQKEHECPTELAEKRLPGVVEELEVFLKEKGIQIELHWLTHSTAELAVVDVETRVALYLGVEELGSE